MTTFMRFTMEQKNVWKYWNFKTKFCVSHFGYGRERRKKWVKIHVLCSKCHNLICEQLYFISANCRLKSLYLYIYHFHDVKCNEVIENQNIIGNREWSKTTTNQPTNQYVPFLISLHIKFIFFYSWVSIHHPIRLMVDNVFFVDIVIFSWLRTWKTR